MGDVVIFLLSERHTDSQNEKKRTGQDRKGGEERERGVEGDRRWWKKNRCEKNKKGAQHAEGGSTVIRAIPRPATRGQHLHRRQRDGNLGEVKQRSLVAWGQDSSLK